MARFLRAALAQLVEHRIRNAGVTGSSPVSGTTFPMILPEAKPGIRRECLSAGSGLGMLLLHEPSFAMCPQLVIG